VIRTSGPIAADAALNDIRDAELAADLADVAAFCFELKHRSGAPRL